MKGERCRVVVKSRPTHEHEEEALNDVITITNGGRICLINLGKDREPKEFATDRVYLPDQRDLLYEDEVQQLVDSLYQGFNATVFAYGASGSGKTYTVLGSRQAPGKQHAQGLVDHVVEDIFARYDDRTCTVTVAIEELYNEEFTDLLAPAEPPRNYTTPSKKQLTKKYQWQSREVSNANDLSQLVHRTLRKRHTGQTLLNEKSSRSHVIVTLTLEQRIPVSSQARAAPGSGDEADSSSTSGSRVSRDCSANLSQIADAAAATAEEASVDCESSDTGSIVEATTYLIGKLYLVDLAGAENIKRSGAEGEHMKEAGKINQSLCHLKTVIEAVFRGGEAPTYRNSRLTYKLKDALGGGNSKLLMIACISTARSNLPETKETLRFAEMARSITNNPKVNKEPKDELIDRLRLENEELRDQLRRAAKGGIADGQLQQQLNALEAAYAELQEEMETKEAKWVEEAAASKQLTDSLQQQIAAMSQELSCLNTREAAMHHQHQTDQALIQQLRQSLLHEKGQLSRVQANQAAASAMIQAAHSELLHLGNYCAELQEQLIALQGAAAAAQTMCAEQQKQARHVQQEADSLTALRQQMRQEREARAEADAANAKHQQAHKEETAAALAVLSLSIEQLTEQLRQEQATREAAEQLCVTLEECLESEKVARSAAEQSCSSLKHRLQCEASATSRAQQQLSTAKGHVADLQQQLKAQQEARQFAESALATTGASMGPVLQQLTVLEQQLRKQQTKQAKASSTCSRCSKGAEALLQQFIAQTNRSLALQQEFAQLKAEQQAERSVAADNVASISAELEQDRWHIAQLQRQLLDTRAAHAAEMAALKQQHAEQLNNALQSSAQKAVADKLRCKVHLALQVHNLMADAQSLSEALATEVVAQLPETPTSTRLTVPVPVADGLELKGEQLGQRQQQQQDQEKQLSQLQQQQASSDQQQQQQPQRENSRYQQQEDVEEEDQLSSDGGEELSFAGSDVALSEVGDDVDAAGDMQAEHLQAAGTDSKQPHSSCSLADGLLLQQQQQHRRKIEAGSNRSSASSTGRMQVPALALASLDFAEGIGTSSSAAAAAAPASAWPQSYKAEDEVDMATAACAFASLGGGELKVENLVRWLKQQSLGGQPHVMRLRGGGQKRKVHLVQDMLAWHQHHVLAASQAVAARSNPTSSRRPSAAGNADGSAACGQSEASSSSLGCITPVSKGNGSHSSRAQSSSGALEMVDLCTPDTAKASAAAAAGAASTPRSAAGSKVKTPRGGLLSPRRAASSPASGSSLWGWLTPRSSKKKAKAAAVAAAVPTSPVMQPFGTHAEARSAAYDCDIASSPAATGDKHFRGTGPAAIAEAVASRKVSGNSSDLSAVQQFLLMEQQQHPELWTQHSAVAGAGAAAGAAADSISLQGGALSAHRSNWRRTQVKATKSSRR